MKRGGAEGMSVEARRRGGAEGKGEDEGLSAETRQSSRKLCEMRKPVDHYCLYRWCRVVGE